MSTSRSSACGVREKSGSKRTDVLDMACMPGVVRLDLVDRSSRNTMSGDRVDPLVPTALTSKAAILSENRQSDLT